MPIQQPGLFIKDENKTEDGQGMGYKLNTKWKIIEVYKEWMWNRIYKQKF